MQGTYSIEDMPGEGLSAQPMRKVGSFIYNRF